MREAVDILTAMLGEDGGPVVYDGRFHRTDGARNLPTAVQRPRPPVFVGGKGDRLLRMIVERADGWNTCWVWTPEEYAARREVLLRECDRIGRDPATVWCSLGLYALCGEDEADLERRFERLRASTPRRRPRPGHPRAVAARAGSSGTPEQIREQAATWARSRGRDPHPRGRRGPVPRRHPRTTSTCWPTPSGRPSAATVAE